MKRILIASILGAIVLFVWSAIVHMNPLTGMMGLSIMNAKEDAVMAAVRENAPQPGMYFFPGMDMTKKCTKEEEAAWSAKYKAGPAGLLLVQPNGRDPMNMTSQMLTQYLLDLGCALLAAFILASIAGSYLRRVVKVASLGLFAWLAVSLAYWNWYMFPFPMVALDAIDQVAGWLLAGLLMAKLVKSPGASNPTAAT
jgi:hypothetical protein